MDTVRGIQKWLSFGLSAEQEDRFREANFGGDIAQARIFVLLILLPFLALLVNDYSFLGLSSTFYALLALRLAFTAYTVLFLKSLRELSNYRSYDRAVFFWGIFLAFANAVINATRPENFVAHTIITVLAVFVIVLAIPNRFTNQVIVALVYTIAQTLIIVPGLRVSPQASFVVLLSMLMVNAIAISSSWLLHFWRRREYLIREEIEKARVEIEMQLIERKKVEEALRESKTLLSTFLEQLPVYAGLFDPQGRRLISNGLLRNLVNNVMPSHDPENSWRWRTWGADGHLIKQSKWPGARALKGENVTPGLDFLYTFDDGREIWMRVSAVPFLNEVGEITGVITVIQDIDKQKRIETALRKSEERFRALVTASSGVIYRMSPDWRYMNRLCGRGFIADTENINPTWLQEYIFPEDQPHVLTIINEAIQKKSMFELEHRVRLVDGSIGWTLSRAIPILDANGEIVEWFGAASDITERKKAEETLAKIDIARQKEIHHRIKNNLQVISSLLDLTAERFNNRECIQDSEVLKAFRESQDRVISMALIHEGLYKGEGFETLNFSPYIEELAENLLQTYAVGNLDINLKLDLKENAFFDMDIAIPLGIIVNELISNSLKYAFPDRKEGEIRIGLHKEENGECTKSINEDCKITNFVLTVSDNGVGIPENFDMGNLDTLGMQLVTSLVDQLDGELELKKDNGTEFAVRFTVTEQDNQASAPAIEQSIE